eukprot:5742081-Prymnesium_polylepis.1
MTVDTNTVNETRKGGTRGGRISVRHCHILTAGTNTTSSPSSQPLHLLRSPVSLPERARPLCSPQSIREQLPVCQLVDADRLQVRQEFGAAGLALLKGRLESLGRERVVCGGGQQTH